MCDKCLTHLLFAGVAEIIFAGGRGGKRLRTRPKIGQRGSGSKWDVLLLVPFSLQIVWLAHQVPQELLLFLFLVLKAQTSLPDENTAKCTVCKESWTAYAGVIDLVWFLFCRECELGCSPVKDQWLTKGCVVFLAFQGLQVSRENSNGVQGEFPLEGN